MGHLAERYGDAGRSGIYRVKDAGIPRAAAMEADALLIEIAASEPPAEWARVQQIMDRETTRACVLLVRGAAALASREQHEILEKLAARALAARAAGRALFAVMVDPEGRLDLPPLYREKSDP